MANFSFVAFELVCFINLSFEFEFLFLNLKIDILNFIFQIYIT